MTTRPIAPVLALAALLSVLSLSAPARAATIASWDFDENGGQTVLDSSGNGHTGVLGGSAGPDSQDPTFLPGLSGSALSFDGNDYIRVADAATLRPSEVWVDLDVRSAVDLSGFNYFISKSYTGSASYALYFQSTGIAFYVTMVGGAYAPSPLYLGDIWDGQWHRIVGGYDGAHVRLYVDGIEVGTGTPWTGPIGYNAGDLLIGSFDGSLLNLSADIDNLRILDTNPITSVPEPVSVAVVALAGAAVARRARGSQSR